MVGLDECHGLSSVLANSSWLMRHIGCGPDTSSESRSPVWGGWLRREQLYWVRPALSSFQPLADLPRPAAASVHLATLDSFPLLRFLESPLQSVHVFSLPSILQQGANYASSGEGFFFCLLWTCPFIGCLYSLHWKNNQSLPINDITDLCQTRPQPSLFLSSRRMQTGCISPLMLIFLGKLSRQESSIQGLKFIWGWNKLLLSICLTYEHLSRFKIDKSSVCSN